MPGSALGGEDGHDLYSAGVLEGLHLAFLLGPQGSILGEGAVVFESLPPSPLACLPTAKLPIDIYLFLFICQDHMHTHSCWHTQLTRWSISDFWFNTALHLTGLRPRAPRLSHMVP